MIDAQTLIREAHDKAERLCALAVEQTPAEYQSFITLIEQRRKVGGSRQAPVFATVRQPYLSVDGRVKWARDEHRRAGKGFNVQIEFVIEPTSGQLLARATLTSELYGTVVAHARVFLGGDGVNESNPLETGETSAVGRALGMWGFGCYGTGIASADEVVRVADRPEPPGSAASTPRSANSGSGSPPTSPALSSDGGPDAAAEAELAHLGQALGLPPGDVALRRAQAASDAEAVAALRGQLATHLTSGELTRDALVIHAACLGVGAQAYRAYLTARYQVSDGGEPDLGLTEAQFREERERFVRRYQDPGVAAGFRDQCTRLASVPAA
jgi:hypothetical protein